VQELSFVPVSSIADHEVVMFDFDYARMFEEPIIRYFRDFRRINLEQAELSSVDWTAMVSALDIDSKVEF
jgi:hypothetical protein